MSSIKKILIVDDEPNNLQLLRQVLHEHYQLMFATNGPTCLEIAHSKNPDLILLDVMMPGMNGFDTCKALKEDDHTAPIPVIFVTAMSDIDDETTGFDVGAVDYIQKPISPAIVLRRVQTHLSLVRAQELEQSQKAAIYMLGEAGHYNDTDTGQHIWRMAAYARKLAELAGWDDDRAEWLELAAPLHDTGKIGTPDAILKAPRALTSEEWIIMRQHSQIGYDILHMCETNIFQLAAEIALCHHERWDGSGYPRGLSGEAIPESGRIVAIADVFDALTMKRVYKEAWSNEDSLREIENQAGKHFDPRLAKLFKNHFEEFLVLKSRWNEE